MDKTKKYINLIVELLLVFSIMFAALAIFVKCIVLNKNTYTNILNKNNVYEQVKASVYDKIDAALKAKNIDYDIKEDIITEDDIRREADNIISGFVEYLETGENNIKPIDTEVYKQRVADILHSIIGNVIEPSNNDLSFNDNLLIQNMSYTGNKQAFNEMIVVKEKSKVGQDALDIERLMTRDEAEARVREILKQKGLTEEQAIKKATEKGITEEQALKILADYGITIDEQPEGNESTAKDSGNSQDKIDNGSNSSIQNSDNVATDNRVSSNNQAGGTSSQTPADKSIKSQLDSIENKLLDQAGNTIEKEVEKINLDKMLSSSKLEKIAKVTSIIYKMFWFIMVLPVIFITILFKINGRDSRLGLKHIRNAFLLAGLILSAVFLGAYVFKVYEKVNINPVYIKETISYAIKHFLIVLSTYGIIIFVIGLFMFIPTARKE
jgi:hypothetical protein